jgi:hypothetical protein
LQQRRQGAAGHQQHAGQHQGSDPMAAQVMEAKRDEGCETLGDFLNHGHVLYRGIFVSMFSDTQTDSIPGIAAKIHLRNVEYLSDLKPNYLHLLKT